MNKGKIGNSKRYTGLHKVAPFQSRSSDRHRSCNLLYGCSDCVVVLQLQFHFLSKVTFILYRTWAKNIQQLLYGDEKGQHSTPSASSVKGGVDGHTPCTNYWPTELQRRIKKRACRVYLMSKGETGTVPWNRSSNQSEQNCKIRGDLTERSRYIRVLLHDQRSKGMKVGK